METALCVSHEEIYLLASGPRSLSAQDLLLLIASQLLGCAILLYEYSSTVCRQDCHFKAQPYVTTNSGQHTVMQMQKKTDVCTEKKAQTQFSHKKMFSTFVF